MAKYRLLLQYAGTRYAGWQVQKNRPTVQGTIQEALQKIVGSRVSVVGSGRTDSGVHARGQVAHFRLPEAAAPERLQKALNGVLPWDIRVMRLTAASPSFHAQKDAVGKLYLYRIYNGPVLSPFLSRYVLQVRAELDWEAMRAGAECLLGLHDFKGFAAAASRVQDTRRTVRLSRLSRRGRLVDYRVEGDGFLHHMVRNIVGTLLEIGRGRRPAEDVARILAARDRRLAGPTAPPEGLYLMKVRYSKR